MKYTAILFVCFGFVQIALSQQVLNLGQVGTVGAGVNAFGNIGSAGYSLGAPDVVANAQLPVAGPYGGVGTGELSVAGEVQATGETVVTGQVPVIGTVQFSGSIPAGGVVSIAGNCGCSSVNL